MRFNVCRQTIDFEDQHLARPANIHNEIQCSDVYHKSHTSCYQEYICWNRKRGGGKSVGQYVKNTKKRAEYTHIAYKRGEIVK